MDEIEQDLRGLRPAFIGSQVEKNLEKNVLMFFFLKYFSYHKVVGIGVVVMMSVWTGEYLILFG